MGPTQRPEAHGDFFVQFAGNQVFGYKKKLLQIIYYIFAMIQIKNGVILINHMLP